jgi:2-(1,2-epoxy-1,2-dihydrophenyl)acetyl-CoA isomerase
LINRMEEYAVLLPKAMELAHGLASGPKSLGMIRQMYWEAMDNSYSEQLDLEAKLQSQAGATRDFEEGVAAFREKRTAKFNGQ